jgi:hypothetical protein
MSEVHQQKTGGEARIPQQRGREEPGQPTAWAGWVVFGAMMMILGGSFHAITGLVALLDQGYYRVGSNRLLVQVDYTTWGWVHLGIGVVALVTGFALMRAPRWARVMGVVVASVSAVVNLGFLAAAPFWAVMIIALDVLVIYAITAHGSEVADFQR